VPPHKKIENELATMSCDLLQIVSKWERSGQGDGGSYSDDHNDNKTTINKESSSHDNIGTLVNRSVGALHNRAAFLNGRPSYLL
jgi:hypothetical protein